MTMEGCRNSLYACPSMTGSLCPPSRGGPQSIRIFNGHDQSTSNWDGLRKDGALWQEEGNCIVHFCAFGASQRGPSLRLPYEIIEASGSRYLLEQCTRISAPSTPQAIQEEGGEVEYLSSSARRYELYVPAPSRLSREQAFSYHVTSRNYFAFLASQGLVGETLGTALEGLWSRVKQWHPRESRLSDVMDYCNIIGYLDLAENPLYASAMLSFAESAKLRNTWIHAFAHCVGMNEWIDLGPDFVRLGNTTKALITRASLEMDLHLARVTKAVGGFLEEELGAEQLGLSKAARSHLDRFRSFLQAYYVNKLGYFPPGENDAFNKKTWTGFYHDFASLYDYLVDREAEFDMASNRGANSGVCVMQNVQAFDRRHGYQPLPHTMPLLPETGTHRRSIEAQKGLLGFALSKSDPTATKGTSVRQALLVASNSHDAELVSIPIVQEYQRFERQKLEERLSVAEARKVRWLLIYSMLQMLISIIKAPKDVKDADGASYPLCILTSDCPPWGADDVEDVDCEGLQGVSECCDADQLLSPHDVADVADNASERISIHPDCEADNAEQYFSLSRSASDISLDASATPAPLRITVPISRTTSIRSSVGALHRSVVGTLSRRNSRQRMSMPAPRRMPSFCEILVEGYGNGMTPDLEITAHQLELQQQEDALSSPVVQQQFAEFDFGLDDVKEEPALEDPSNNVDDSLEPTLEDHQLDIDVFNWLAETPGSTSASPTDSHNSFSGYESGSSLRSSYAGDCDSPLTAASLYSDCDEKSSPRSSASPTKWQPLVTIREPSRLGQTHYINSTQTQKPSLNVGCYTPTGSMTASTTKPVLTNKLSWWQLMRTNSGASLASELSAASSSYPEDSQQAADIEEEETRGRRRSRGMDRVVRFELHAS